MAGQDDGCGWLILLAAGAGLYFYFKKPEPSPPPIATTPTFVEAGNTLGSAPQPTSVEIPPPPKPTHNYDFRDGDTYGYEAALSDDDRKAGKAARDVVIYRYAGLIEGKHTLEFLEPDGAISSVSQCSSDCHAIRTWAGGRSYLRAFDPSSILGAAMEDAIKGRLRKPRPSIARAPPTPQVTSPDIEIPPTPQS